MKNHVFNALLLSILLIFGSVEACAQDCYEPLLRSENNDTLPDVTDISTTSATLHWYDLNLELDPTAEVHWIVLYSTSNLTSPNPANGTAVYQSTDPFDDITCQLSGLQSGTLYYCYIWASCSANSVSENYASLSFRTACEAVSVPFSEDFDNVTYTLNTSQPDCWSFPETYSYSSVRIFPLIGSIHNSGRGSLNFRNRNCAALPTITEEIHTLRITFTARTDLAVASIVVGVMSDVSDIATFEPVDTVTLNTANIWTAQEVHFDGYAGSGHNIAFRYSGVVNQNFYIDDIYVDALPDCMNPMNLVVSNLSADQATITWTEVGSATQWRTLISDTPITDFSAQNPQTVTSPTFFAHSLSANTTYYFYVQSICNEDYSEWTTVSFTTDCGISLLPSAEDFAYTIGGALPSCWNKMPVSGSVTLNISSGDAVISPHSGTGMVQLNSSIAQSGARVRLVSNELSTMGVSALDINFWWYHNTLAPNASDEGVQLQYSFDGTTWSNSAHGQILRYSDIYTGWTEYHVIIPEVGNHTGVYVGFLFTSGRGSNCYLDHVTFQAASGCYTPAGLIASNVQGNSADFSWTEVGFATAWNLLVSEMPVTNFSEETPITVQTTEPAYSAQNLNPMTTYYAYVQAVCSATEHSEWSPASVFTTGCGDILYLPYREDFDAYGTCSDAFPDCWTRPMTYVYSSNGCTTPSATDLAAHTGGKSLLFCSPSNGQTYAITPGIAEEISHVAMTFYLYFENLQLSGTMDVGLMSDPNDYASFRPVATITPANEGVWTCCRLSFANENVTGTGYHIAFRHNGASDLRYCLLDQVIIQYAADCWDAVNPTVSHVTGNAATISWTDINEQPVDWHVKISDVPLSDMNAVAHVADTLISADAFSVDYLIGHTTYYYYIASDCGNNRMSQWVGGQFTTDFCNCYVTLYLQNVTTNNAWSGARIVLRRGTDEIGEITVPNGQWEADTMFYTCSAANITYTFFAGTHNEGYAFQIVDSENNTLFSHPADQTLAEGVFLTAIPVCGQDCSEAPVLTADNDGQGVILTWTAVEDAYSYVVYRNGQKIASYITSTHYRDTMPLFNDVSYAVAPVCITGEGAISNVLVMLGISDDELFSNLKIYPNPARENLTIAADVPFCKVEIMDMLGKICLSKEVNAQQTVISLANFTEGMYLLKIQNRNGEIVRKFIVKK